MRSAKPPVVLYATCLEHVDEGGIFRNQVVRVLQESSSQSRRVVIHLLCALPLFELKRSGLRLVPMAMADRITDLRKELAASKIRFRVTYLPWIKYGVHLRWPFLFLAAAILAPVLARETRRVQATLLHSRSFLPAFSWALGRRLFSQSLRVVVDARGFIPEEGILSGRWELDSLSYRMWRRAERLTVRQSDSTVVLSPVMRDSLALRNGQREVSIKGTVIYPSVHTSSFGSVGIRSDRLARFGVPADRTVLVYAGSLGSWHDARLMAQLALLIMSVDPAAFLLIVTRSDHDRVRRLIKREGITTKDFMIVSCSPQDVPPLLRIAHFGLLPGTRNESTLEQSSTVLSTMPSKVGEYLAAGLPVIVNATARGASHLVDHHGVGIVFQQDLGELSARYIMCKSNYRATSERCAVVARRLFDVASNARRYVDLYYHLGNEAVGPKIVGRHDTP